MYTVSPFKRWHVDFLLESGDAEGGMTIIDSATLWEMEKQPNCRTVAWNGTPIMCGGTLFQWPGRALAWAFLNAQTGRHMVVATRVAKRLVAWPKGRVDCTVRADFQPGLRWIEMLGFRAESYHEKYGPLGEDHIGFVRFNEDGH